MLSYYAKRAFSVLQREGLITLLTKSKNFISTQMSKNIWLKLFTLRNQMINRIYYDAVVTPYKPIRVNANDIEYTLSNIKGPEYHGLGQIKAGNWDDSEYLNNLEDNPVVKGIRQRVKESKRWEETAYYNHKLAKYNNEGGRFQNKGYDDPENYLRDRFDNIDDLISNIRSNGYKQGHSGERHEPYETKQFSNKFEVLVSIDRKGRIHRYEGIHRLAIARALDLEIPVQVVCRHKQWQELRDDIHNNGLSEEYQELRGHPDLQDILN